VALRQSTQGLWHKEAKLNVLPIEGEAMIVAFRPPALLLCFSWMIASMVFTVARNG
jgi:hypothetical protein